MRRSKGAMPVGLTPETYRQDISGYKLFSAGDTGYAHMLAHRMLDECRLLRGRALLGRWLNANRGTRSEQAHLQWHMAVFELETGDWHGAYTRFRRHILPIAATSEDALTDAPALMLPACLVYAGSDRLEYGELAIEQGCAHAWCCVAFAQQPLPHRRRSPRSAADPGEHRRGVYSRAPLQRQRGAYPQLQHLRVATSPP
ncbi:MAG: hypothetical protein AMS22_04165 [Thiotrichales bacterium SG8_50]|nr:MAG: hypothetical protein AMS22_04165 [Thiotrichales bacterium SG8_50]